MKNIPLSVAYLFLLVFVVSSCSTQKDLPEAGYNPELKLKELGITLPSPPQPVANYVNGVRTGKLNIFSRERP